ncbi:MAG: prepilin-type N-terminal cleavage/methylation domain-containing protein [Vulcanimicrobiota bacterium]
MGRSFRGFNLLEMIIAVTVFSTIAVALMGIWSHNARVLRHDQDRVMAAVIAENIMESQISLGFKAEDIYPTDFTVTHYDNDQPMSVTYKYEVKVEDTSTGPEDVSLKHCVVIVRWSPPGTDLHEEQLLLESMLSWQS